MDIPATSDNIPGTIVLRNATGRVAVGSLAINTTAPTQETSTGFYINSDITLVGSNKFIAGNVYFNFSDAQWKYSGNGFGWGLRENAAGILNLISAPNNTSGSGVTATVSFPAAFNLASGSLGIGASPNAAAQLDVSSTTRGFLPPRMTTTQRDAITSPPAGLMLYNSTTNKLQVRTDTAWVDLH